METTNAASAPFDGYACTHLTCPRESMAEALFNVVVQGQLREGFEYKPVLEQLQQQLRLPESKAKQLLAGKSLLVKRGVSHEIAQTYCNHLINLGVATFVQSATMDNAPTTEQHAWFGARINLRRSLAYEWALFSATARTAALAICHCVGTISAGAALLYYLWHYASVLSSPPLLFNLILYSLPAIFLAMVCALISRPLLPLPSATTSEQVEDTTLQPFLTQLCTAIAAPPPTTVYLDTGVTARVAPKTSAKDLRHGVYTLTIGLPLLQCLPKHSYAGLLASVIGPVTRPTTARHLYFIAAVRCRLQACANQDDWLGRKINARFSRLENRWMGFVLPVRYCLGLSTRYFTRGLDRIRAIETKLSAAISNEGDRYLLAVAGTDVFTLTLASWRGLERAHAKALRRNFDDRGNEGLIEDLPALVRHYYLSPDEKSSHLIDETTARIEQNDHSRLEHCGPDHQPGIIGIAAASPIPENQECLALAVTQALYRQLQIPGERPRVSAQHMIYAATEDMQRRQRAHDYLNGWFHPNRFWKLPDYDLVRELPLRDAAQQLNVCVNEIRRLTPDRQTLLAEYEHLLQQIREIHLGQHLLTAGLPLQFRHGSYDTGALPAELSVRQQQLDQVMERMSTQEALMGGRLALGLRLCGHAPEDVDDMHRTLIDLQTIGARLHKFEFDVVLLAQLQQYQTKRNRGCIQTAARLESKVAETTRLLLQKLERVPYPLHGGYKSLREYMRIAPNQIGNDTGQTVIQAQSLLKELRALNEQLAIRAADYGVTAEEAYKIERIKLIASE